MKQCPDCKRELKDHLLYCPYDGHLLIAKKEEDRLTGVLLDGKFRLAEKIGEGGMGKVYRATHAHLDYTVAVKVLHPHLSSDHIALERFRREAQTAVYVRHPNAVEVTDFGVTRETGIAYLVMEFLEGLELRERMKQQRQLGYEETFLITQQTCAALWAAHSKGIVHRDLKPENIWLVRSEDGATRVKVLDFGIARLKVTSDLNRLTQQGVIVGTPYYMSPEQCRGEDLDARSDLYSLGVILYEMLTGQVPFQASTPIGVVVKHANEQPRPLRNIRPEIPPAIEDVVLKALRKRPEERQESALQLAQELESALRVSGLRHPDPRNSASSLPPLPLDQTPSQQPPAAPGPPGIAHSLYPQPMTGDESSRPAMPAVAQPFNESRDRMRGLTGRLLGKSFGGQYERASSDELSLASRNSLSFGRMTMERALGLAGSNKRLLLIVTILAISAAAIFILIRTRGNPDAAGGADKQPAPSPVAPAGMTYVRGGTFVMGSDDPRSDASSKPASMVAVGDFFIDADEVTNEQYYEFVRARNYRPPPHWQNRKYPPGTARHPVYNVTWEDAKAYAEWAGKRLPAEREWEYAARGAEGDLFPWGNRAWTSDYANLRETGHDRVQTAGAYPAGRSWCGANDMIGNVAEWVADSFTPYPGSSGRPDPQSRVVRGGSYRNSKDELLSVRRWTYAAGIKRSDIGFRCAK